MTNTGMTTQPTPGPWRAQRVIGWCAIFADKMIVANVGSSGQDADEVSANARLIAAAPSMLAALRAILEDECDGVVDVKLMREARALLREIHGGQ